MSSSTYNKAHSLIAKNGADPGQVEEGTQLTKHAFSSDSFCDDSEHEAEHGGATVNVFSDASPALRDLGEIVRESI